MDSTQLENVRLLALIPGKRLYGSERGNLMAVQALQSRGATCVVLLNASKGYDGEVGEYARKLGLEIRPFPFGLLSSQWMRKDNSFRNRQLRRLWTNSRELLSLQKAHRITHVLSGTASVFPFIAIALTISKVQLIYRVGDSPPTESWAHMLLWKWKVHRANQVVAISRFIKSEIIANSKKSPSAVNVIHNPAWPTELNGNSDLRARLKRQKKQLQLVYIGQLTEKKGVIQLLQALIDIDNPNVGIWIVGQSKFQGEMHKMVAQAATKTSIEFEGYQAHVQPFLELADWHIMPSIYEEPLGNVVQEAKLCRTPSIISNKGGLPELVRHGIDGIILEEASASGIKKCIEHLLTDKTKWPAFSEAASDSINPSLSPDTFCTKWENILK